MTTPLTMSILVADDDPVIRRLFEKRLIDEGYRTNKNLITMIYLIGGKLNFALPT
jgi:hypothetical protein